MLKGSLVAILCGALAVAGLGPRDEYFPYEVDNEYPTGERHQWAAHINSPQSLDDHPKRPPLPPHPHIPWHHPPKDPKADTKAVYQALSEDSRYVHDIIR